MFTYDPNELGDRQFGNIYIRSEHLSIYQKDERKEMFNKEEQRRRAQQLTQSLAAQGEVAPVLPMPKIVPPKAVKQAKPAKVFTDMIGNILVVGDRVAYSSATNARLKIEPIHHFSQSGKSVVFANGSSRTFDKLVKVAQ